MFKISTNKIELQFFILLSLNVEIKIKTESKSSILHGYDVPHEGKEVFMKKNGKNILKKECRMKPIYIVKCFSYMPITYLSLITLQNTTNSRVMVNR